MPCSNVRRPDLQVGRHQSAAQSTRKPLHRMRALPLATLVVIVLGATAAGRTRPVETLAAVGGLPAHIAGQFSELSSCQQTAAGEYFVFDRRGHAVYAVAPPYDTARVLVQIGAEPGRLLSPSAFDMSDD